MVEALRVKPRAPKLNFGMTTGDRALLVFVALELVSATELSDVTSSLFGN